MDFQKYLDFALNFLEKNTINFIVAILILIIGFWGSKKIVKLTQLLMAKRGIEVTLQKISW